MKPLAFASDKYRKARGVPRWLLLSCGKCGEPALTYQKDGPGMLKRLYLDRIVAPEALVGLQKYSIKSLGSLVCKKCKTVLGIPYIYEKEQRAAYRLFAGSLAKSIVKADSLKKIKL